MPEFDSQPVRLRRQNRDSLEARASLPRTLLANHPRRTYL
jgi:hypothetical protein